VVQAVQTASQVMAELAKAADADKGRLVQLASDFMQQIQVWVGGFGGLGCDIRSQ
jgi:hypothetical protein